MAETPSRCDSSDIRREMDLKAVTELLWLALKQSDEAGLPELVDQITRVYQQAARLRHEGAPR